MEAASEREIKRQERRQRILALTWRLIARDGLRAANMRAIAAEAGYANGALSYYFSGKEDLMLAAYEYVLARTATRIARATVGVSGLVALERFCDEVLPLDDEKLLEARIVLPFWENAQHQPALAQLHERGMLAWRAQMRRHLREAQKEGGVRKLSERQVAVQVEGLLAMLSGAQVLAVLSGEVHTTAMQRAILRGVLDGLRPG